MTWAPLDNQKLTEYFPHTPEIKYIDHNLTSKFYLGAKFNYDKLKKSNTHIILVRGLLGDLMWGHFKAVKKYFENQGFKVSIAPVNSSQSVAVNVVSLKNYLEKLQGDIYLFSHSKGGLETLTTLHEHPELSGKVKGVLLVQTPYATSKVLESVLQGKHVSSPVTKFKEQLIHFSLSAVGALKGAQDLVEPHMGRYLLNYKFPFPVLHFLSWSIEPTSWLDSYHRRLNEIAAGVAHDGQFYTHEMTWPCFPNILVGGIDHAQPVVGGKGFATAEFWDNCFKTLLSLHEPVHLSQ